MEFTDEQQTEVNRLVGEARVKAREKATTEAEAKTAKEQEEAKQAAMAAQAQWQELAETRDARIKELEAYEPRVKAYEEKLDGMLKDTIESLGDAAKNAVEGLPESMTAIEKLNWLNKNEGLFKADGDGVGTPGRPKTKKKGKIKASEISRFPIKL